MTSELVLNVYLEVLQENEKGKRVPSRGHGVCRGMEVM